MFIGYLYVSESHIWLYISLYYSKNKSKSITETSTNKIFCNGGNDKVNFAFALSA